MILLLGFLHAQMLKCFQVRGKNYHMKAIQRLNYVSRSNHISDLVYVTLLTKGHCLLIVDIRVA